MLPQGHFWGETEPLCVSVLLFGSSANTSTHGEQSLLLQACGFCCIVRVRAFSSPRGAHQKARVTPLHPCRSHPTLIPHPSEGLFCTLGETTSSFTALGWYCQSWQPRWWWEIQLWPQSFIEISEISIKHLLFFLFVISSIQTTRWRILRNVWEHKWAANERAGWYYHVPKWVLSLHYERS